MLQVGQVIDRYKVESVLGTGGTAVVYRVKHTSLGTPHALKVLSVTSDVIRERMLQEGRVQATLRHPNVVPVTDVLEIEGQPGLLMEFIEGPSLQRAMREFRLPLEAGELLFTGIVAGVQAAHDLGFVHRDIKPANILLKQTTDGFIPKVTDFGLAKILRDEGEDGGQGHTRAGIAMGTPAYMASEQIRDASNVDQRADVFSLGCILYELVCGQRAFPGDDAITIYSAIMRGEFVPPLKLKPELPARIDMAIRGSLQMERAHRLNTCADLLAVLKGAKQWVEPDVQDAEFEDDPPTIETSRPARRDAPELMVALAPHPTEDALTSMGESDARDRVVSKLQILPQSVLPESSAKIDQTLVNHQSDEPNAHLDPLYRPVDGTELPRPDDMATVLQPDPVDLSIVDEPVAAVEQQGSLGWGSWTLVGLVAIVALLIAVGGAVISSTQETTPRIGAAQPGLAQALGPAGRMPELGPVTPPQDAGTASDPGAAEPGSDSVDAATDSGSATQAAVVVVPPSAAPVHAPVKPPHKPVAVPVQVKILSKPPTAIVAVDGEPIGRTPFKGELLPGAHKVQVTSSGKVGTFSASVSVGGANRWCYDFDADQAVEGSCP